jgi:hypothetical protein
MTDKQIGGYEFRSECIRIKNATTVLRNSLSQIIETNPGPQTLYMLVAKMAVQVSTITDAVNNIEDIGKEAKANRK